jgi:hypothetical protein
MRVAPVNININIDAAVREPDRVVECNHGGNRSVISSPLLLCSFSNYSFSDYSLFLMNLMVLISMNRKSMNRKNMGQVTQAR